MKDKVWEIRYEGYTIRVINKTSFFPPKTSEVLEINGVEIEHHQSGFTDSHTVFYNPYTFNGIEKTVEVRFGQKSGGLSAGCQVLVDGALVGGDKKIMFPEPKDALASYKRGFFFYFLTVGLLQFGLFFAVGMTFFNRPETPIATVVTFLFHFIFFGFFMACFMWRGIKKNALIAIEQAIDEEEWPFDQAKRTATLTTRQVMEQGLPVLRVVHYADDHSWAFTCGTSNNTEDAMTVSMDKVIQRDASLKSIADLPPGWTAYRHAVDGEWVRSMDDAE